MYYIRQEAANVIHFPVHCSKNSDFFYCTNNFFVISNTLQKKYYENMKKILR